MAKDATIAREERKIKTVKRAQVKRAELKEAIRQAEMNGDHEAVMDLRAKFNNLSRNTSASRVTRRCRVCGRPHGVYRKFGLCRIHLREYLMRGDVAGARKSSW